MRILLAIPTIDRDQKYFEEFYSRVRKAMDNSTDEIDVLVLTRDQDVEIQKCWQPVEGVKMATFENYEIEERHNLPALVRKRNFAIEYAKLKQYDALWFVDADIRVQENTLIRLVQSIKAGSDIVVAPYRIRELGCVAVGVLGTYDDQFVVDALPDPHLILSQEIHFQILLGGFGCTLIDRKTFDIRCNVRMIAARFGEEETGTTAEDVGFFLNAYEAGKKAYCLSNHLVDHMD
jgi:hypothetical protein